MKVIVTYRRTRCLSMRISKDGDVRVSAPYGLPKAEVERFVEERRDWIEKALVKVAGRQQRRAEFYGQLPLGTRQECAEAVARLNAIALPMLESHAAQMGVAPSSVSYRATISRWGCCNVKTKAIQLSLYLLLLPQWCIESVVVHELAHLIVPNHGPQFYAVLDRHFPRWREARAEIRRISSM